MSEFGICIEREPNDLIERAFQREGFLYIACKAINAFFTYQKAIISIQKVFEALNKIIWIIL